MNDINPDRKAFHKGEYLNYSVDELASLIDQMSSNPARHTAEAHEGLREALIERKLDARTLLMNLRIDELKESQAERVREQWKKDRSKKFDRRLGRVLGFFGIPMSLVVGWVSLAQAHLGGLAAALVWLGLSIWTAFFYKGD